MSGTDVSAHNSPNKTLTIYDVPGVFIHTYPRATFMDFRPRRADRDLDVALNFVQDFVRDSDMERDLDLVNLRLPERVPPRAYATAPTNGELCGKRAMPLYISTGTYASGSNPPNTFVRIASDIRTRAFMAIIISAF